MKGLLPSFFLVFTASIVIGQPTNRLQNLSTDSLEKLLAVSKADTNQVLLQSELIFRYQGANRAIAMEHAHQGLALARKLHFEKGEANCLRRSGVIVEEEGHYPEALEIFLNAIKISERINDPYGIAAGFQHIGEIYYQQSEYIQALPYFSRNKEISEALHDSGGAYVALVYIGRSYVQLNKLDSALIFINMLKSPFNLYDLGYVYSKMGKDTIAMTYFRKNISVTSSGDSLGLSSSYLGMATLFKKSGHIDSCIFYARKALEGGQRNAYLKIVFEAGQLLSRAYEPINEHESFRYYKIAMAANDTLFNTEKVKQVQNLFFVEQQRQQTKAAIEQAYQNKIKLYSLFTALGVFILLVIILYRNNRSKQKTNSLLASQKEKVESTLQELKSTQAQLIQSEKMASLGELTSGIAHEIQNPLNFVNNFSEVNKELLLEMKDEIDKGNINEVKSIADDLISNQEKINHHGKRADAIVKGMMQHSMANSGQKELTDINALADEYLRLSYHGLRAKDKTFNATLQTDFDENIGKINMVPQDIGRVLLNLYNNAFYAVSEKKKTDAENYQPAVSVQTKKLNDKIEIKVSDNGNGIPQNIVDKIFQPFFTTKPTGQGTGLGLSLSYDIIKAHGGEIKVETKEGEGTTFIIQLPLLA